MFKNRSTHLLLLNSFTLEIPLFILFLSNSVSLELIQNASLGITVWLRTLTVYRLRG